MTTALDIINSASKKAGILGTGQTLNAPDVTDAFNDLNDMVSQWQRKRWLIWHLVDVSIISTGAQSYTVGPGGDFNVMRPDRLEAAFFRQLVPSQPNEVDYPLDLIQAREDYNSIALKTLSTWPQYIFYDSAYPLGVVYPWPIPQADIYAIHLTLKEQLNQFATLNAVVNLPPEYIPAFKWNLAQRQRISYRLPPDPELNGLARDSLGLIRASNTQIPVLKMPRVIGGTRTYNILSDQAY